MKPLKWALIAIAAAAAAPASAQSTAGQFVNAVRNNDNHTALQLLDANPVLIDARDDSGTTALIAAIRNRDIEWTGYLLKEGADPNIAARDGDTPLIAASRLGMDQAVDWLLQVGARVDDSNRMGETPLIVAVQQRHGDVVERLLKAGADPDKADTAAGYSARDYAKRDSRNPELLRLIETTKPKPKP